MEKIPGLIISQHNNSKRIVNIDLENGVIEKNRYYHKLGNHIIEIDEFLGTNKGLVIAEIELKNKNKEIEGHTYGNLANCYAELGDIDKSLEFYKKQYDYTRKANDVQSKAKALFNIAYTYFHDLNNTKKALFYSNRVLKILTRHMIYVDDIQ